MCLKCGKSCEFDFVEYNLETFKNSPIIAMVGDTYNIYKFTDRVTSGKIKEKIESSEYPIFVIRPDSGEPVKVLSKILDIMEQNNVDFIINAKGYKVFKKYRLLWGDGIDLKVIKDILQFFKDRKYSADNIAFGMGGGLLQKVDRDTQKFAFKCSSVTVNGVERDVFKAPVDTPWKKSKAGRLKTVKILGPNGEEWKTVSESEPQHTHMKDMLETVFFNGEIVKKYTFDEVRENAKI